MCLRQVWGELSIRLDQEALSPTSDADFLLLTKQTTITTTTTTTTICAQFRLKGERLPGTMCQPEQAMVATTSELFFCR